MIGNRLWPLTHQMRSFPPTRFLHRVIHSPPLFFLALALAILGPLILPGRIITLDSAHAVNWDVAGYFWNTSDGAGNVLAGHYNSAPIAIVLKVFDTLLPFWVVEKLWLLLLFWLAGMGASRLPFLMGVGRYYAGVLYVINPFIYSRFIAGQWGLLGAYAIIPFALTSFLHLLEQPNHRNAIKTALLATVVGFFQVHGLGLLILLFGIIYVCRCITNFRSTRGSLAAITLTATVFLAINLFWIIRYFPSPELALDSMDLGDLTFFGPPNPQDVISLRGFWLTHAFIDVADLVPLWWISFIPVLFLALDGAQRMLTGKELRWVGLGLCAVGITSVMLAGGPTVPFVNPVFSWIWDHVPAYRAFRDSHKFLSLLALCYAYLGAYSLQEMTKALERSSARVRRFLLLGITLVFFGIITYGLPIFGTLGQLKVTEFPEDWQTVHSLLGDDEGDYNVLVLPWHMYMPIPWLPNRWKNVANPAATFFGQSAIAGDNLEIPHAVSQSSNPASKYVEELLANEQSIGQFGKAIAPLNARYVVLIKAADYDSYSFLSFEPDLELLYEGPNIALFVNRWPTSRAYLAKDIVNLENFDDYISSISAGSPLSDVYQFEPPIKESSAVGSNRDGTTISVKLTKTSPTTYDLEPTQGGYVVLTLPQHQRTDWQYQGEHGLMNLGMFPAFQMEAGTSTVTLGHFWVVDVPLYLLAVGTTLVTIWFYFRGYRRDLRGSRKP